MAMAVSKELRVYRALRRVGSLTASELAVWVGMDVAEVRVHLSRLRRAGEVRVARRVKVSKYCWQYVWRAA